MELASIILSTGSLIITTVWMIYTVHHDRQIANEKTVKEESQPAEPIQPTADTPSTDTKDSSSSA